MERHRNLHGLTLPEAVVVLLILLVVGSILYPVIMPHHGYPRRETCSSQVRQLSTAVQMYVQDDKGHFPSLNWATAIETYVGSPKIFFCPSDASSDRLDHINYGYSGLLLDARGRGVQEYQVSAPTEVGTIADSTPTLRWAQGGGIIGGTLPGVVGQPVNAAELEPRHGGVIVGYCDGHAKFIPGKLIDTKDIAGLPGRAFYQVSALGMVDNPAGGLQDFTPGSTNPAPYVIGGEYCTRPLLVAAAQAWAAKAGAPYHSPGFAGQNAVAGRTAHYAWGRGDGVKPTGRALAVAKDAVVVIVSKNCKIANIVKAWDSNLQAYDMTTAAIAATYRQWNGYSSNIIQAYTYDGNSGTRAYFTRHVSAIPALAVTAKNDLDMVAMVAADPYGIGYCSSLFADTDKVSMLAINGRAFPNGNPKYRWLVPDQAQATGYPFIRTLWISLGGNAWRKAGDGFGNVMLAPSSPGLTALQEGPLFKTGYFK